MKAPRKPAIQKIRPSGSYWHLCHYELLFKKLLSGMTIDEASQEGDTNRSMIHYRLRAAHKLVVFYIKYHYPNNSQKILNLME